MRDLIPSTSEITDPPSEPIDVLMLLTTMVHGVHGSPFTIKLYRGGVINIHGTDSINSCQQMRSRDSVTEKCAVIAAHA